MKEEEEEKVAATKAAQDKENCVVPSVGQMQEASPVLETPSSDDEVEYVQSVSVLQVKTLAQLKSALIRRLQVQGKATQTRSHNSDNGTAFNTYSHDNTDRYQDRYNYDPQRQQHNEQNSYQQQDDRMAYNAQAGKFKGKKHYPNKNKGKHERTDRSKIICWQCGVAGHFSSDCTKKGDGGRDNNNRSTHTVLQRKSKENNQYNAHFCYMVIENECHETDEEEYHYAGPLRLFGAVLDQLQDHFNEPRKGDYLQKSQGKVLEHNENIIKVQTHPHDGEEQTITITRKSESEKIREEREKSPHSRTPAGVLNTTHYLARQIGRASCQIM